MKRVQLENVNQTNNSCLFFFRILLFQCTFCCNWKFIFNLKLNALENGTWKFTIFELIRFDFSLLFSRRKNRNKFFRFRFCVGTWHKKIYSRFIFSSLTLFFFNSLNLICCDHETFVSCALLRFLCFILFFVSSTQFILVARAETFKSLFNGENFFNSMNSRIQNRSNGKYSVSLL